MLWISSNFYWDRQRGTDDWFFYKSSMLEMYGLRYVTYITEFNDVDDQDGFEIVDEQKAMTFMLKYSEYLA